MCHFSNGLGYEMPYGQLIEFWEIETHSRVHGGCHMSTFSDRGVTAHVSDLPFVPSNNRGDGRR